MPKGFPNTHTHTHTAPHSAELTHKHKVNFMAYLMSSHRTGNIQPDGTLCHTTPHKLRIRNVGQHGGGT